MLILYCNKCGKRIPQEQVEKIGIVQIVPDEQHFCQNCAAAELAAEALSKKSSRNRVITQGTRPGSDSAGMTHRQPRSSSDRQHSNPPAKSSTMKLAASWVAIGMAVGLLVMLLVSKRGDPDAGKSLPAARQDILLQSTDVDVLRTALEAQGNRAPLDAIQRLGELPSPSLAETVMYKANIDQGNPNRWRRDRGSTVTLTTEEGEKCLKVEKGNDRLSCYGNVDVPVNRTRVKLRLFQKGLNKMQLSISCKMHQRFNVGFSLPPEGQWQDVVVDISKAMSNKIKIANQPMDHIEIHGFRKAANNGAYFLLANVEVINGGL
ncbi:MAG: hypothetical protein V1899_00775 [Planctomycetota bacterium]